MFYRINPIRFRLDEKCDYLNIQKVINEKMSPKITKVEEKVEENYRKILLIEFNDIDNVIFNQFDNIKSSTFDVYTENMKFVYRNLTNATVNKNNKKTVVHFTVISNFNKIKKEATKEERDSWIERGHTTKLASCISRRV